MKVERASMVLLVVLLVLPLLDIGVYAQSGLNYIVVVVTPGLSLNSVNSTLSELNITARILLLDLDGPANPDYYAYWLLLGRRPELEDVSLLITPEYELMSNYTERIRRVWSNAALVDVVLANPELNVTAVNSGYNLTRNAIKPVVLEVPVNGTLLWGELSTNITTELVGDILTIKLERFNVSFIVNVTKTRITSPKPIRVEGLEGLASGEYYVVFYVLEVNELNGTIKLLFPGSLRTSGFASPGIEPVGALLVPWALVYAYREVYVNLPLEAREWIVNLTIETTRRVVERVISDVSTRVYIVYAPHTIVAEALNITSGVGEKLAREVFTLFTRQVKPGSLLVLFSPVDTSENGGRGFAVFHGEYTGETDLELTVSQFTSLVLSYSSLSPLPSRRLLDEIVDLRNRAKELEGKVSDLTTELRDLNATLQETSSRLAYCESARDLLENRLRDIDRVRAELEELKRTAYLYISTGLLVTVAIATILGFFTARTCRAIAPRVVREVKARRKE
jgi:chaperonin cofactor prefoldin